MPKSRSIALQLSRRRWSDADARVVLAALDASGLSPRAFAMREGMKPQRLYYWRDRQGDDNEPATRPTFVEVQRHVPEHIEIALRSSRVLRVRESIDTTT